MLTDDLGKQLSPCICSKVKYALGLKEKAKNNKKCTQTYWNKVVDMLGKGLPKNIINTAKNRTDLFL